MKKISFILLLVLFVFSNIAHSQTNFQKVYSSNSTTDYGVGKSIIRTIDGGYVIMGSSDGYPCLIKTDSLGDTIWAKAYSGSFNPLEFESTQDGGYIITGTVQKNYGSFDSDVLLLKTDSLGNILWYKTYGWSYYDYGCSVHQTSDNGFLVTGYTIGYGLGETIYLIRADSVGNLLWSRTFYGTGFNDSDYYSAFQTSDGNFVLAGRMTNAMFGGLITVSKIQSNGNLLWTKSYEPPTSVSSLSDFKMTNDGGFIILATNPSIGKYLIKIDSLGAIEWSKLIGTGYGKVNQCNDGGYLIYGSVPGPQSVGIYKTDLNGNFLWAKAYGSNITGGANFVKQTADNGYIITGTEYSSWSTYLEGIYLIKTDSFGNSGCNESVPVFPTNTNVISIISSFTSSISSIDTVASTLITQQGSTPFYITLCPFTSISENNYKNNISIYPSPNNGIFNISISSQINNGNIEVYNSIGALVFKQEIINQENSIELSSQANGLYFVKVINENKIVGTGKIIKE